MVERKRVWHGCWVLVMVLAVCLPRGLAQTSTNGNGTMVDVGTWFVTYNCSTCWNSNFGGPIPIYYRPLDNLGNYSIPDSSDSNLADFYIQQLANAKIDFVILDLTNGGLPGSQYYPENCWITKNAKMFITELNSWNSWHSWQIHYAIAVGTYSAMCGSGSDASAGCFEEQAQSVYEHFVNDPSYGPAYYYVNGSPLLINFDWESGGGLAAWNTYMGDKTYGNHFTVRGADNGCAGAYGWQMQYGTQINSEVETVSPGWNNHNGGFAISRNNGAYYTNQWNTILNNPLPSIVVVAAFNDYNENQAVWITDTSLSQQYQQNNPSNPPYEEPWTGQDGQLHPAMYWDMTISNIIALRSSGDLASRIVPVVSSVYPQLPASYLTDGNRSTFYSSYVPNKSQHTEYVEIDWPSAQTFNTILLTARSYVPYGFPFSFQIQVWNGSQWLTRINETNFVQPAPGAVVAFQWGYADHTDRIRLVANGLGTDNNGDYVLQFGSFEVYNDANVGTTPY